MATARLPVLRVDTYEDALPIVLIPPSDDAPTASPRAGTPSEAEAKMLRARNRSPKSPALHPIRSMQEAFNESLIEATKDASLNKPKLRHLDAKARREHLIAQEKGEELYGMRWRYRPGQTQHELCKLMSQISFGMNLLLTGKANSDDQVVSIIQGHIDEIDEFLDVALEDFQQATADLTERIKYLRLPLEHLDVFEKLLEDRNYRAELLHNNENIDHILSRTMSMLTQYESDFAKGLRSTKDFITYLAEQRDSPRRTQYPDIDDIYKAMKGNTDGWRIAFLDLQQQGINLDGLSTKLSTMVATIQSKAGEVSRRTWTKIEPFSLPRVNSIRASQQTSPASSTSPSVMSTRSPTSSNSISESITPTHAPLDAIRFNRLTISAALGPALENPFEDLKFITHQDNDAIADNLVPDDGDVTVDHGEDILSISLGEARGAATNDHGGVHDRDQDLGVQSEVGVHMYQTVEGMTGQESAKGVKNEPLLCEIEEEQEGVEEEVRAEVKEETKDDAYGDLYLLQPRTYTPRLPAPLPSPAVKEYKPPPQPSSIPDFPKRSSLRQRVSLKGNAPPESIKIPAHAIHAATPTIAKPSNPAGFGLWIGQ
ncbi:unnamed protein product [Parascedosporium putredinis]|uniref:Uncharacterized protein n=1 Tax=Parascedosporium putredinis TaxID=1442378 RepID=A0A9P1H8K9_9PEZI|nr:unnamed protein product [Parascedosporium putredinis]CAI8002225.1 unnamed protein product [Parascedosporium putredinis]